MLAVTSLNSRVQLKINGIECNTDNIQHHSTALQELYFTVRLLLSLKNKGKT